MVYDLVKNHGIVGMSRREVEQLLGAPTAFYDYDEFPAYAIGLSPDRGAAVKVGVLAFVTDHNTAKFTDFVIEPKPK